MEQAEYKARIASYRVAITSDYLDRNSVFLLENPGGDETTKDDQTCGFITLDGVEHPWWIDRNRRPAACDNYLLGNYNGRWVMKISTQLDGQCSVNDVIDIRIGQDERNEGTEFRTRPDAEMIYNAIVDALQERHHPDHCHCEACELPQEIAKERIVERLNKAGVAVEYVGKHAGTLKLRKVGL